MTPHARSNSPGARPLFCLLTAVALALPFSGGCKRPHGSPNGGTAGSSDQAVAPGVVARRFQQQDPLSGASAAYVVDVDLRSPGIGVHVVSHGAGLAKGAVYADAQLVKEWCAQNDGVAGINGGFFGKTDGGRKQVMGLLAGNGVLLASGGLIRSPSNPQRRFVRSVLGFGPDGTPHIGWAVGQRGRAALLTEYATPLNPTKQQYWSVISAVACGPRLIQAGKIKITDREERLVHAVAVTRTFVAYSLEAGKPRHLVLGIGSEMTFADVAAFLQSYFRQYHQTDCAEAMCLDGGSSSQLVYRSGNGFVEARPTPVSVPTAVVVMANGKR